ncbi:hypothetical protein [Streptomyces sp. RFCAC02]|uniref:hypothetical protein n=1 Tax=Streptomyces sp. RFCAC02 TaxID=2499143 RepID=UPI00101F2FDF|nr:hypothetical protein [Streptomyces sp. RFCAC02]
MAGAEEEPRPPIIRTLAGGLWFPMLFFFGFLFCYMLPFHAPAPHDVRVAVSGTEAAEAVAAGFEDLAPGNYEIVPADTAADARRAVLDRDVVAAYTVEGDDATLHLAKADGASLEQVLTATFGQTAAAAGQDFHTNELVPTAPGDVTGTGLFYLAMVWNIVPYITVMMLLRAVALSRTAKLLTLAGVGAFVSVVGFFVGLAMDVVPFEPLAILYAFLTTQAIAWVTFGLVPFVRQFIPGVAITLFVLLSIPSSGGAIPYQMVPGFFRFLHPIMPLGNLIDALHGVFYFDGKEVLRPTLVLCAWFAAGIALNVAGAVLQRRRARGAETEATADEPSATTPEDPILEAPKPRAVPIDSAGRLGEDTPMVVGKVCRDGGEPVPEALLSVIDGHGHALLRTRTDERGRYAVTALPEEHVTLLLLPDGGTPAVAHVLPCAGHTLRQDFSLAECAERSTP